MNDLYQTKRWTDASGVTHKIKHMTDLHRRNVCGWLRDHADKLQAAEYNKALFNGFPDEAMTEFSEGPDFWIQNTPLYQRMARGLDLDAAPTGSATLIAAAFQVQIGNVIHEFRLDPL